MHGAMAVAEPRRGFEARKIPLERRQPAQGPVGQSLITGL